MACQTYSLREDGRGVECTITYSKQARTHARVLEKETRLQKRKDEGDGRLISC